MVVRSNERTVIGHSRLVMMIVIVFGIRKASCVCRSSLGSKRGSDYLCRQNGHRHYLYKFNEQNNGAGNDQEINGRGFKLIRRQLTTSCIADWRLAAFLVGRVNEIVGPVVTTALEQV